MNLKPKLTYIALILFLFSAVAKAQEKKFTGDPDRAFEVARELAFNNQRAKAQDTLLFILTKYPNYHDIRSFLASTYSWDGNYKLARREFDYVLKRDPDRKTTWEAAINNELWSENPFSALEKANEALTHFPKNEDLLYLKAKAEENSNYPEDAFLTIQGILKINPTNNKAQEYQLGLINRLSYNEIGFASSVDIYSSVFDPMQYHTLQYSRQTKYGSLIAKINFNRRFNDNGFQFEVDMYPKIVKGLYAYVNFGVASTYLYPDIRYGAELYKSLPYSLELSAGFRTLKYTTTTNIYTGSLGWYFGNSYLSLRTYLTPGDGGLSKSGTIEYRKYRSDADNFFSIAVGAGFSPEIYQFDFGGNEEEIINLKSQKFNAGYFFTSKNKKNLWGTKFGISRQEISFDVGNYFWIYSVGMTYDFKFR